MSPEKGSQKRSLQTDGTRIIRNFLHSLEIGLVEFQGAQEKLPAVQTDKLLSKESLQLNRCRISAAKERCFLFVERADQGKDGPKQGLQVLRDADNDIGHAMCVPCLFRGCRTQFHEAYPCVDELDSILYTVFTVQDAFPQFLASH